jgi:hypothetical protein
MVDDAADRRELRDHAREIKFLVDAELGQRVVEWMRANLNADPSGTGAQGDEYETTSLYFDTPKFDTYYGKQSYGKSKYRIRQYGGADVIFLERKFRTDRLLAKRRTAVSVAEMQLLEPTETDPNWKGYWFHRRILLRGLRPVLQFSYDRTARQGTSETGPVRLTVDRNLRVLPMPDRAFIPGTGLPVLEDKNIMELKYRIALPALFKQLLQDYGLTIGKVSKYRVGLGALGITPPPQSDTGYA